MKVLSKITKFIKQDKIDRIICRLLSSWFIISLLFIIFNHQNIQYLTLNNYWNIFEIALCYLLIYVVIFLFSIFLNSKKHFESIILLISFSICIVFWIINYVNFYFILTLIIFLFLITYYCLTKNEINLKKKLNISNCTLYIIVGALFAITVTISYVLCYFYYNNFIYENFDLGVFTNIFYHLRTVGRMINSNNERDIVLSHYLIHISPIIYLALPLYLIIPHTLSIEITQILIAFSGIFALLKICKQYNLSNGLTLIIAIIFLFYPAIYCGFHTGFHENCFLSPLLLWLFYFSISKKYKKMYITLLLLLIIKEDVFIYAIIYSLFMMFNEKEYKRGIMMIIIALCYFAITYTILSQFSNGVMIGRFYNLVLDDNNMLNSVLALFTNPGYIFLQLLNTVENGPFKIEFFLQLLLPLSFLPLITKKFNRLILLLPLIINIITKYVFLYDIDYQYTFATSTFLIYSFILYVKDIKDNKNLNLVLSLSIASIFVMYNAYMINPINNMYNDYLLNKKDYKRIDNILNTIPKDATINSSSNFVTHIAYRDVIYDSYFHNNKLDVDYVLIDLKRETITDANYYLMNGYEIYYDDEKYLKILKKR